MVTREDVYMVYKVFLHREPESDEVIENSLKARSFEELCQFFMGSEEFRARLGKLHTPLDWPPIDVVTEMDPIQAAAMVAHVEATWRKLGETEPYWSVLSVPQFRSNSFDEHEDEFNNAGQADVLNFRRFADRLGTDLSQFKCCLELGSGVGRLTRQLAGLFPRVIATDISDAHLSILKRELQTSAVEAVLVNTPTAIDALSDYDVFFSLIVLQHNPPPIMAYILRTVLGKLKPGGIAYFQLPTYKKGYSFEPNAYLQNLTSSGEMEMHVLPQNVVFDIAASRDCKVLEVREDGYTGDISGISNTFFLQKRG